MVYKFFIGLVLALCTHTLNGAEPAPVSSFLVQEDETETKKSSKNVLKEEVGDSIKEVLHTCATLHRTIGALQQQLATVEEQLLTKVEQLIDNRAPFKKAKRVDLSDSKKLLNEVNIRLSSHVEQVTHLRGKIATDSCLKQA